ncbi:hypothetical protein YPPY66_2824, partial [Yersinia pestis PY-66]
MSFGLSHRGYQPLKGRYNY